jgi:hypothetical protein
MLFTVHLITVQLITDDAPATYVMTEAHIHCVQSMLPHAEDCQGPA